MNIGILCHSCCGGSVRVAVNSAIELGQRGHHVHLFSRTIPFMLPKEEHSVIPHVLYENPSRYTHPASLQIEWPGHEMNAMIELICAKNSLKRLDVLHVHYALPFIYIAEEVKKRLGSRAPVMVATLHGTDVSIYGKVPSIAPRMAKALNCFNTLTTVSIAHARLSKKLFSLKQAPLIIPNFVDLKKFLPKRYFQYKKRPKILHVSNFRPVKDPCGVAHIFVAMRKQIAAELWLVGEGEEMDKMRQILVKHGLEEETHFLGFQSEVSSIYSKADLLIMPSKSESFCLTALEAMSCGVPIIATNIGGFPELIEHGHTGFLFPLGHYEVAADFAVGLLKDPELYKRMSQKASSLARRYDQKMIVSSYESLYTQKLAKKELIHRP